MKLGLIGKKIGMTREFFDSGISVPVTVVSIEKGRILDVTMGKFMAYHGAWYRDLNQFNNNQNCIAAGHIHVGGNINWNNATIATEESIRTLINYIDSFIYTPGDLNQDNIIDILDLVTIVNFILGDLEFTNLQLFAADMNEDSIINIQDIILVINLILN